jgi:putative drug exporter of the RND superfamily
VASRKPSPAPLRRSIVLPRVARLVAARPRFVIGAWLLVMLSLAGLGLGLADRLVTQPIYVNGSESKHAHELALREFGHEEAFVVVLRGPAAGVEAQGPRLAERIDSLPRTLVVSPWATGEEAISDLRPKPGVATLLVNIRPQPGESIQDVVSSIRQRVAAGVAPPVRASIAGEPTVADSYQSALERATSVGERIALPVLLLVLLLIFRSVFAAAIPVIIGGVVVAATRGAMDLLLPLVHIESFALSVAGMMGLALGVDYSLLVVSRFRQEMRLSDDVAEAVRLTVVHTGRAIVPAGCGLIFATASAALILPSALLTSSSCVVIAATVLSMLSALFFVPAALTVLGKNLDRWALPMREDRRSAASSWSRVLSGRPVVLASVMFVLLFCAAWALTLKTDSGTAALLPAGDAGRQQQEEVEQALGPGWIAPLEVIMNGRGKPITTPGRLRALAVFQRKVEEDPGVSTMIGFRPIERGTRRLGGIEQGMASQERGLTRLGGGLARATDGSAAAGSGVAGAANGATGLGSAVDAAGNGADSLANGLNGASDGSRRLSDGLDRTGSGSGKLASGVTNASAGSSRLAEGLTRALEEAQDGAGGNRSLKNALHNGNERLAGLHPTLQSVEEQLATAQRALQAMTSGRGDPQYGAAAQAVGAAADGLHGKDPETGESDPAFGVDAGIEHAQNQFSLGVYLANRAESSNAEARDGLRKLARNSKHLADGMGKLADGSGKLSDQIVRLAGGSHRLSPGLRHLEAGAKSLAAGLGKTGAGANGLAAGLGEGTRNLDRLTSSLGQMHAGVERQTAGESQLDQIHSGSPGLFRSGYFYLASLDGSKPDRHRQAAFLINLNRGGQAARMLIVPRYQGGTDQVEGLKGRLERDVADLSHATDSKAFVGGIAADQLDLNAFYRDAGPLLRIALMLVSLLVLIPVLRSLVMPVVSAVINLVTVAASFGLMSLLFDGSLLGGPGYVDAAVIPTTIMVMFGLGIDYEVFLFARMREEYVRTGSPSAAITNGIDNTAHVITGAAMIMIAVFLAFSISSFITIRDFGVAQSIAVFIDAFVIRLAIFPAVMRALGKWAWWMPRWLDRLLPGGRQPA